LGSSSSITVGLLHALYTYQGELVTAERLAREACEIEIDTLCSPIGIQDQHIAAYGGLRHFKFRPDGTVSAELISLNETERREFGSNLHLFFLNRMRKAGDILKEQKAGIEGKTNVLDSIRDMVEPFKAALLRRDFDRCGRFLDEGWAEKKKLANCITNPEINRYYEVAREAGALGGKVAGAGAGGFLLLYCQRWKQKRVFDTMHEMGLKELPFNLDGYGSRVAFSQNCFTWL
jgi:D-glycero-alpha-D-manno-heptose-7-phosphate kinase